MRVPTWQPLGGARVSNARADSSTCHEDGGYIQAIPGRPTLSRLISGSRKKTASTTLPMSCSRWALGWLRRHWLMLLGAVGLLAYYLWLVSSTSDPLTFSNHDPSYYNQLGDGFLAGHLHLLKPPPPHLMSLPNPYDPVANASDRAQGIHDMSLYRGKLYLYWGPVPVLLLYLPFRLLSLGEMPDSLAVALFAFVGTCFALALLRYLTRRYLPKTPSWMLALGTAGVVAGSALPFTLRRTAVYEVAICAAYCFMFAGLYLLATGVLERPYRLHRLGLASLCFGLAVGCRTTMVVPALLLVAALVWILLSNRPRTHRELGRVVAALMGPLALCGVALAAYNVLRFGSVTEFGQHYQLPGYNARTAPGGHLSYIAPGAWYYLFARAHITAAFPFFHLTTSMRSYPGTLPNSWNSLEPTGGLVSNVPIAVLAFLPWTVLRRRDDRELRWVATTLACLGFSLILLVSYAIWGATMRYEVDFATLLLIPSVLVWFALSRTTNHPIQWAVKVTGVVAIAWGVAFGLATGMTGYYNSLLTAQPGTYEFLERATAPIATAIVRLQGDEPKVVRVAPPERLTAVPNPPGLEDLSVALTSQPTVLYLVAPSSGRYRLAALPSGDVWKAVTNLCTNTGFESNTACWLGFNGDETLTSVTTDHFVGSKALRVSYPNADLQGTVYNTALGQAITEGTPVTTSVWMKGAPGAKLEMQVRIVNTDGTSSGTITSFTATGRWQHKAATADVALGKTGDVVQILALRRAAAGPSAFLIDGAFVSRLSPPTQIKISTSDTRRERVASLGELRTGLNLHLECGLNRLMLSTTRNGIVLNGVTLTRGIG